MNNNTSHHEKPSYLSYEIDVASLSYKDRQK